MSDSYMSSRFFKQWGAEPNYHLAWQAAGIWMKLTDPLCNIIVAGPAAMLGIDGADIIRTAQYYQKE